MLASLLRPARSSFSQPFTAIGQPQFLSKNLFKIVPRVRNQALFHPDSILARYSSNGEMRKLLNRKIASQNRKCALCKDEFTDYSDVVPDHINPRGMGGAWRDDHPDNIQAVHWWCNGEKGSSRA